MPSTLIISACSATKTLRGPRVDEVLAPTVITTHRSAAQAWFGALALAADHVPARELYAGRGFRTCRAVADRIGADLAVASAGLGLVEGTARVPSYDCTLGAGPSPRAKLDPFVARTWWQEVCAGPYSIADPVAFMRRYRTVLAVLPASYLSMMEPDLLRASDMLVDVKVFSATPERSRLHGLTVPRPADLSAFRDGPRSDEGARRLLHHCRHLAVSEAG